MSSEHIFNCDVAYKACWLFVRHVASVFRDQDLDIMAIEMAPEDYGGSFDPAVKERWLKICSEEVERLPMRIAARFIEEEGPWGQGTGEVSRDLARRLQAPDPVVAKIWDDSWKEATEPEHLKSVMDVTLNIGAFDLLRNALRRSPATLQGTLATATVTIRLTYDRADNVREILGDEIAENGVGADGAINQYGEGIDDLIDRFAAS